MLLCTNCMEYLQGESIIATVQGTSNIKELEVHLTEGFNTGYVTNTLHKSVRTMPLHAAIKIIDKFVLQGGTSIYFVDKGVPSVPYMEFLAMYAKSKYLWVSVDIDCSNYINTQNVDKLSLTFDAPNIFEPITITNQEIIVVAQNNLRKYIEDMQFKTICVGSTLTKIYT